MSKDPGTEKPVPVSAGAVPRITVDDLRRDAYARFADPVFFMWQAGEATEGDWRDARERVKAMHPKGE